MSFFQITWFSSAETAEKRSPFPAEIHALAIDCDQLRRRSLTGMLTSEAPSGPMGRCRKNHRKMAIYDDLMWDL